MPRLRDKLRRWCAANPRAWSAVQVAFIAASLSIGTSSGTLTVAWMIFKEQMAVSQAGHAAEIARLQQGYAEELASRDQTFGDIIDRLDAMAGKQDALAGKTERAANTANTAASKVDRAAERIERIEIPAPPPMPARPQYVPEWKEHP